MRHQCASRRRECGFMAMVAPDKGIGFLILSSADLMQTTRLLFGIMVLSGMGVSFVWILEKLERFLLPWRE